MAARFGTSPRSAAMACMIGRESAGALSRVWMVSCMWSCPRCDRGVPAVPARCSLGPGEVSWRFPRREGTDAGRRRSVRRRCRRPLLPLAAGWVISCVTGARYGERASSTWPRDAGTTPRYVSFVETGRAQPSRQMVVRLARALDVPLRERNDLLLASGFAPLYSLEPLTSPLMARVDEALTSMLVGHEPFPAVVMDRGVEPPAGQRRRRAALRPSLRTGTRARRGQRPPAGHRARPRP